MCVCVQDNKIRWPPLSVPLSALPQSTNSLSVKNNYSNLFSFSRPPLLIIYYLSLWCVEGGLLEDDKKTKFLIQKSFTACVHIMKNSSYTSGDCAQKRAWMTEPYSVTVRRTVCDNKRGQSRAKYSWRHDLLF